MNNNQNGPIFDASPGWGDKTKKWFSKYFYKAILPIIVIVIIGYGIISRQSQNSDGLGTLPTETPNIENTAIISQVIAKGDGKIQVARRAVVEYAASNANTVLTPGQKVYLETVLSGLIESDTFKPGNTVNILSNTIREEIVKYGQLSKSQIEKWSSYALKAGIK